MRFWLKTTCDPVVVRCSMEYALVVGSVLAQFNEFFELVSCGSLGLFKHHPSKEHTTMSYTQLTEENRIKISSMRIGGEKQCQIAKLIGCHPSTISHGLRRSLGKRGVCGNNPNKIAAIF